MRSYVCNPIRQPLSPQPQLAEDGRLHVHAAQQEQMAAAVARVQAVLSEGRYLCLPYTTLFEYLKVGATGVAAHEG